MNEQRKNIQVKAIKKSDKNIQTSFQKQMLMPLMNTAFRPGQCKASIAEMSDSRQQEIAWAEYYYFSGQPEKAVQITEKYRKDTDLAACLAACWIDCYAHLAIGHIDRARQSLMIIQNTLNEITDDTPIIQTIKTFIISAAATLLHLPLPKELSETQTELGLLPPGVRFFGLYVKAHYAYLQGEYAKSIGIIETALWLGATDYPIAAIYLHLAAVMDYISLRKSNEAEKHLRIAWTLAKPDDLLEGFGEHHGLLGGMLEAVIKKEWPDDFKRIINITYRFSAGWRKIHNPDTGHDVADNLTTTEFAVAMLAARGWTNREIAEHMNISPNTVKQHLSTAMQKLNISDRKQLKHHMLY